VSGTNGFHAYCTHAFSYWSLENKLNLDIFNILLIIFKLKNGIMIVLLCYSRETTVFIKKKTKFAKALLKCLIKVNRLILKNVQNRANT
jgi:hypothetical protein